MMDMRRCCIVISINWIVVNLARVVMNVRWNDVKRTLGVTQWMMMDVWRYLMLLVIVVALLIVI
jgi:hypothetical protein